MYISYTVSRRLCFFGVSHHQQLLLSFYFLLQNVLETQGEQLDGEFPFRNAFFKIFHYLNTAQLWISVFIPIYWRKKFLWWWLSKILVCGYSRMSLGVIWLLCCFNKTVVFCFSLKYLAYLVSGSWSLKQYQAWVPSLWVGLKSNQLVVG